MEKGEGRTDDFQVMEESHNMKCPHCDQEIPGTTCPKCHGISPENARYCMKCGESLVEKEKDAPELEDSFDPEERVLCPDGACTGIMIEGVCSECGKKYEDDVTSVNSQEVMDETAQ
jgi:hypothetical protein